MRPFNEERAPKTAHRYASLWEPLEIDPTFVLKSMFGAKAAYLDGRLQLFFMAKTEPWRGVFVCTERRFQAALRKEFPVLTPHRVLSKWLYLAENADEFERVVPQLVALVLRRDPRIGVDSPSEKRAKPTRIKQKTKGSPRRGDPIL